VLREIGKTLEIAIEKEIEFSINGITYRKLCTPSMLKELAVGFLVSEGVVKSLKDLSVEVEGERVFVKVSGAPDLSKIFSSFLREILPPKIESKKKFRLEELRKSLEILEIEEYRKTRGYHVAAVVCGEKFFRAYDVGRHNAVDKAIGFALLNEVALENSFLLLSGRISKEIAFKCANAGISLIVSKAAILSSAIDFCIQSGLSAVSFATNIVVGNAVE